jgi:hypothetical protein
MGGLLGLLIPHEAARPLFVRYLCKIRILPQSLSREVEMRSDRPRRNSKMLRDLAVPPTLQIVEENDFPLHFRKPLQGGFKSFPKLRVLSGLLGCPSP